MEHFLKEVDTKRLLVALKKVEGFSVPNMHEFALAEVNRFELKFFKSERLGRQALLEMGFAPYNFVSACVSIAIMVYFGEPVLVHEPYPLKGYVGGRLENRNPLNPFFVEVGNLILKMGDGFTEEDLERIAALM